MPFPINHDLHAHTTLSLCCHDHALTTERLFQHAVAQKYDMQAVTNHLWDAPSENTSAFYREQDLSRALSLLPLPEAQGVRRLMGCETEYCGGDRLALQPSSVRYFDFIVIPVNHFHMIGLTRPAECDTEEKVAELFLSRLEELTALNLPWRKVGIAHLTCDLTFREGSPRRVFELMDEGRLRAVMRFLARVGAGIELNSSDSCWPDGWQDHADAYLRIYRFAKEAGCTFYHGSDAHAVATLDSGERNLPHAVEQLGLTEIDRFTPGQ